jgi:hypothetical protein
MMNIIEMCLASVQKIICGKRMNIKSRKPCAHQNQKGKKLKMKGRGMMGRGGKINLRMGKMKKFRSSM